MKITLPREDFYCSGRGNVMEHFNFEITASSPRKIVVPANKRLDRSPVPPGFDTRCRQGDNGDRQCRNFWDFSRGSPILQLHSTNEELPRKVQANHKTVTPNFNEIE